MWQGIYWTCPLPERTGRAWQQASRTHDDDGTSSPMAPGTPTPTGASSAPSFLTVAEVAAMLRVSKMTVYRMVHSGDLPAMQVGRSFRVPARAVDQYLAASLGDWGHEERGASGT